METNQRRQEEKLVSQFSTEVYKRKGRGWKKNKKRNEKSTHEIEKNYAVYDNSVLKLENRSE